MKKVILSIAVLFFVGAVALVAQDPDPQPSSGFDIWKILTGVFGVASMFFAGSIGKVRTKLKQVLKLGSETVEAFDASVALGTTTVSALDDNVVDAAERKAIKAKHVIMQKEWSDVKAQWKIVWGVK